MKCDLSKGLEAAPGLGESVRTTAAESQPPYRTFIYKLADKASYAGLKKGDNLRPMMMLYSWPASQSTRWFK